MRVAALYDIHGNLPALEAVLAEIRAAGVDRVVVGGDVLPGPMPDACLDVLAGLDVPVECVHGNGESEVLAAHRGEPLGRTPERMHPTIRWVASQLSAAHLAAIAGWPLTRSLELPGIGPTLFCHATPRSDVEIFTCLTPEARLAPVFAAVGAALVVCGHTHMPFDRTVGEVRVVNAGSVGMPFGRPGAAWLLLADGEVQPRRTAYELDAAMRRIRATAYPPAAELDLAAPPSTEAMLERFEAAALR